MNSSAAPSAEPAPILAISVSRDVQNFDLLIEDMEAVLGDGWGDLTFTDALAFLTQTDARHLEFVALAIDENDEEHFAAIASIIRAAIEADIAVIVVAEEVSPVILHQILKLGAREFVPYPLPDGALAEAVDRIRAPAPAMAAMAGADVTRLTARPTQDRHGVLMPVQGLAGGTGASTFAVNLAWELATVTKTDAPRVCLVDLDLQTGAISTYLDLPQREAVFELLTNTETMDSESFLQALLPYREKLHVLTAPAEMLPLDLVLPTDIERILECAMANFDYVVVDMPKTVVQWTETVLNAAHVHFAMLELDMRSAQNAARLIRALKAEALPFEKLRFLLNRAPGAFDLNGKSRVRRLAETLDIAIEVQLPDGGRSVTDANDRGAPLAEVARKNALRKEIRKIAASIHELNKSAATLEG
ncbi:ATPase, putative [Oceaniovalibus guishaninsula JLT2003]|uniref:ATPase, putative n=1 Tax=Oceaniovalibus guishaninsula JLT2003 TaxID=1231392 RepID=K2HNI2_9RHOB|nr:AAA family ATPase [Oceaniovalibus guishaninsula]EKE44429.1 ATPase, putative [Oceaniovalibus guishaninsula JLT2003]